MRWNLFGEDVFKVLFRQNLLIYDTKKLYCHSIDLGLKKSDEKGQEMKQPSPSFGGSLEERLKSFGLMKPSSSLCVKVHEMEATEQLLAIPSRKTVSWKAHIVPLSYDVSRSLPVYFIQNFTFCKFVDEEWNTTGKKRRARKKSDDENEEWKDKFDTRDLSHFEPFEVKRVERVVLKNKGTARILD
jgi:hypothetical protein